MAPVNVRTIVMRRRVSMQPSMKASERKGWGVWSWCCMVAPCCLTIVRLGWLGIVAAAEITLYHKVRKKSRLVDCWQLTREGWVLVV